MRLLPDDLSIPVKETQDMNDSEMIKRLQEAQLEILKELDRVCRKLRLTYCLAFGTCLGAVRHRGFIPWDDDIDVYMRVKDLEKLQRHADLFQEGFFLQFAKSDPEYGLMITRLRNSNTTLIEDTAADRDINHGIFIDIYPLFNTPKDGWRTKKLVADSRIYRLMLYGVPPKNRGTVMRIGSKVLLEVIPKPLREKMIKRAYRNMKQYKRTGYLTSLYGDQEHLIYPEKWFFPVRLTEFEDMMAPVHADTDRYLRMTYGNYMQLPPVEKRVFHHNYVCIDFEKPYTDYKGIYYCRE